MPPHNLCSSFPFPLSPVLLHSPFLSPVLTVSGHETHADLKLTSDSQCSFSVFFFPRMGSSKFLNSLGKPLAPMLWQGGYPSLSSCYSRCWSFLQGFTLCPSWALLFLVLHSMFALCLSLLLFCLYSQSMSLPVSALPMLEIGSRTLHMFGKCSFQ